MKYFDDWKLNVENRDGNFTVKEKSCMQLSHQTIKGFRITTLSIIECIRVLSNCGANFVLTGHFNQDPLEQLFSHIRHKSGSNVNPTVFEAGHSLITLRVVNCQAIAPKRGNTTIDDKVVVDDTPLPKRHRNN